MNSADGKSVPGRGAGRRSGRIGPDPDLWRQVLEDCASGLPGRRKPKRRRSISPVRWVLIAAAVAACGYFLWRWLKPVDEREVIAGRLGEIAEIVRFLVTKKGQGTIDQFYIRRYTGLAFD